MARRAGLPGLVAALALVAAYTGAIYAIQNTSVANAMLLFACSPLLAAVLGWVWLGERVRPQTWAAMAVAGCGIAVMVWDKTGTAAWGGNLAALGSALGFAIFTVALRWGKEGEMMPSVFLSGLLAVVITAVVCLGSDLPLVLSPRDSAIAFGMGVVQVGAGMTLYTIGSKTVPAVELTILSMAEVLLGPVWVWLFLGETATRYTLIGGAILLLAIAGNAISGARRKPPPGIV
ncbi:DMT family transporter [Seohaeicola zhoushanensis]